ncbi:MAG: hypothetical protein A2843_01150 [Candidatus Wildermuthbacteria bacterium RIFCSPHIGHO2_01_FULL_48_27b]|nr:MAG: hypothetical protein A2843_01150 [Candidatus Wildermuthbacteria bacterium RIFCSPHIGHO2_01_FULL_48_27b]
MMWKARFFFPCARCSPSYISNKSISRTNAPPAPVIAFITSATFVWEGTKMAISRVEAGNRDGARYDISSEASRISFSKFRCRAPTGFEIFKAVFTRLEISPRKPISSPSTLISADFPLCHISARLSSLVAWYSSYHADEMPRLFKIKSHTPFIS